MTDHEPRVCGGETMIYSLAAAMRRGWSDGAVIVGTDYVFADVARWLWTLRGVRSRLRQTLASFPDNAGASEGTSYRTDPADEVAVEARAVLREATWVARQRLSRDFAAPAPLWSDGVYVAVQRTLHLAMMMHVVHAGSGLLVTGCLSGAPNRAHQLLQSVGLDPKKTLTEITSTEKLTPSSDPRATGAYMLATGGILTTPRGRMPRALTRLARWWLERRGSTPVLLGFEREATRQAVRLGAEQVTPAHILVAILTLDQQIRDCGWEVAPPFVHFDNAARLLREHGMTVRAAASKALTVPIPLDSAPDRRGFWRRDAHSPPTAGRVAAIIDRARYEALDRRHPVIGPDHVLLAALSDRSVARLVKALGIDPVRLAGELRSLHPTRPGLWQMG